MARITEDYVSFETAKLLKEKGFDERGLCVYTVDNKELIVFGDWVENSCLLPHLIAAPTLQMAMKWLRVKYNIHIEPRYFPMPNIYRYIIIRSPVTIDNISSHPQYFSSYEDACEAAIKYCLENLI